MIYWIIALVLLLLTYASLYYKITNTDLNRQFFIVISVFLIIFAATRDHIGVDFVSYENLYYSIRRLGDLRDLLSIYRTTNYEPLFVLTCILSPSFHSFLFFMSILGVGIKCAVIWKYCTYKYALLLFYFCNIYLGYDMGVMRQGVAMSFMLVALFQLKNKKHSGFALATFISVLFHSSGFLLVPLLLWELLLNKQTIKWIITGIAIVLSGINNFLPIIDKVANKFGIATVVFRLEVYKDVLNQGSYLSTSLRWLIVLLLLYVLYKQYCITDDKSLFSLNAYWYGCIIAILTRGIGFISGRGTVVFFYFSCFAIEDILKTKKNKDFSVILLSVFVAYYIYQMIQILPGSTGNNFQSYIPYSSWLFR